MSLADLSRLDAARPRLPAALAERLAEVGFHRDFVQALSAQLPGLPGPLFPQGLAWLTMDDDTPAALALRLLVLNEDLSDAQLQHLFGAALTADLKEAGLLVPQRADWRFPLRLELVNQLMIVSDPQARDPATVMAVGGSTQLLAGACHPCQDVDRILDVGCGSGTLALLMAGACREVVATDINPRALQLARFNAAFNGVHNIDWRQGHLFDPVAGERFDLIASQPPFLPHAPGTPQVLYLHGGARGDELALELLAGAPAHLSPQGLAIVLSDFPLLDEPLHHRLQRTVPGHGLMLLHAEHATAAATHVTLYGSVRSANAARDSLAMHRHLQDLGVAHIVQAVVVLHPGVGTLTVSIEDALWAKLQRSDIDRLLADCSNLEQAPAAGAAASQG